MPHSTSRHFKSIGTLGPIPQPKLPPTCKDPSLQILRPAQQTTQGEESSYSQTPTSLYLTHLSETLMHLMSSPKGLHSPLLKNHISPHLRASRDPDPSCPMNGARSLEAHFENWPTLLKSMPEYRAEMVDTVVEVERNGRRAKAWSFKRVSGLPGGVCKEDVAVAVWEVQGQTWVVTGISMLRGVGAYDF